MTTLQLIKAAISRTASEYKCNGNHDSDLIANMLDKLYDYITVEEQHILEDDE